MDRSGEGQVDQGYEDPDFEPQSRPRCQTWHGPMRSRPRLGVQGKDNNDDGMKLEPTIEEGLDLPQTAYMGSEDNGAYDAMGDIYTNISPSSSTAPQLNHFSDMLIAPDSQVEGNGEVQAGLHHASLQHTNSAPNFSAARPSSEIGDNNLLQPYVQTINEQGNLQHTNNQNIVVTSEQSMSSGVISNTATPATQKAKSSSRKNAWGSQSYADLITEAIESSPEKRLTLAQIYEYMVKNIDYFSDKGESNSSAGWKVSNRLLLSYVMLHCI